MKTQSENNADHAVRWRGNFNCLVGFGVAVLLMGLGSTAGLAALIFSENMGTPSATTAIGSYSGWQNNSSFTFTGTGDVRTSSASSGYTGASGSGNVFLNGLNESFQIALIDTVGYSSLTLSFGASKSTTASTMSELTLAYSIDGVNYSSLSIPAQPTGTGTTGWRQISGINLPFEAEGASNLRLRWTDTVSGSSPDFRLDDIMLEGTLTLVPEPITWAMLSFGTLFGGLQLRRYLRSRAG